MADITYTTKKYRILQKTSDTTANLMHPETEADIVLIKPFEDISATNTQVALKQLNDKINIAQSSILFNTKEGWNAQPDLRTQENIIYVYTNAFTYNDGSKDIVIAGIKIGDGNAYLKDKAFVTDKLAYDIGLINDNFTTHLNDNVRHITSEERSNWNHKANYEDEVVNETLVLNRN